MRVLILFLLFSGCASPTITWHEIVYSGAPREPSEFPGTVKPDIASGCIGSLRVSESGNSAFAAWWQTRPDSSAILMAARAMHGGPWEVPVIADSTDRSVRGCGRPPPGIAADERSGYVHIAYFLERASGSGVFFAHSMDSASTFHAPVPIVFGKNPARVSIDADGDRVVVAFEDPNASQPMIGVSLSSTMGHIFERRSVASSPNGRARQPMVELDGDTIRLWWREYSPNPAVSATRPMYRTGTIG